MERSERDPYEAWMLERWEREAYAEEVEEDEIQRQHNLEDAELIGHMQDAIDAVEESK